MKKIISAMTMVCLSFSCFAESYFIKIADNEYVMQYEKNSTNTVFFNGSSSTITKKAMADYTPTHIFTYPDGNPVHFRDIKRIDYTESKVIFYKDIKSRKCCIDILDDQKIENKCRIIGINHHNGVLINGSIESSFEVYDVAEEANSFVDDKQRLIYIDHTGLYIVSKKENSLENISQNYFKNGKFDFKGEIIKISAIDGKREVLGFDENKKEIFAFNCPSNTPVFFESNFTEGLAEVLAEKFAPVLNQIQRITGIRPKTTPPSEKVALQRMAEILDVPEELLVMEDGEVFLVDARAAATTGANPTRYPGSLWGVIFSSYVFELKKFISLRKDLPQAILHKAYMKILSSSGSEGHERQEYKFDTSPEAQQRRRNLAEKPWPSEFTYILEQIEQITGIRPKTPPSNENVALKRVADIFEIPVEILIFKEGKIHVIDMNLIKMDLTGINDQLKALCNNEKYSYKWLIDREVCAIRQRYKDQIQRYLPVYSGPVSPKQIKEASIQITANVCNKWSPQTKKFSSDAGTYLFDTSDEAKKRRKEIAQKPWDEV